MTTGAPSDPLSLIGKTLAGHFLVQELVAEGRTSIVYRGEHVGPKRPVALKCLKISLQLDAPRADTFLKRMREEMRSYGQVARNDTHFVRSIGTGMTAVTGGSHLPYSVLEWLDGHTLAQDLAVRAKVGDPKRGLAETAELLAPLAHAVAAAHLQKLQHGDIAANNVFLSRIFGDTTEVKILDFGIARVIRDVTLELSPSGSPPPTHDPFWRPSPGYEAPEQKDRSLGEIGSPSDVYALAIVFMETLTGKVFRNAAPKPSSLGVSLPEGVEKVLDRALVPNPKERWPGAGEFWAALEDALRVGAVRVPSRPPAAATGAGDKTIRIQTPMAMHLQAQSATSTPVGPAAGAPALGKQTVRLGTPNAPAAGPPKPMPAAGKPAAPGAPIAKPAAAPPVAKPAAVTMALRSGGASPKPAPTAPKVPPAVPKPTLRLDPKLDPKKDTKPEPTKALKEEPKTDPKLDPVEAKTNPTMDKLEPKTDPKVAPLEPKTDPQAAPKTHGASDGAAAAADAEKESSKPIVGTPVLLAEPSAPVAVSKKPAGPVPPPPPGAGDVIAQAAPPPSALAPSSGPISAPPPPPAPGTVVPVAPGPTPGAPASQRKIAAAAKAKAPAPSETKSVAAAAPATRAQVFIEDLPSVIVEDGAGTGASSPVHNARGAETIRLNPPSQPQPFVPPPPPPPSGPSLNAPLPPAPPGLPPPPVVARPGVIIMPPGTPPSSSRRMSYDERRSREKNRIYVVVAVSFLVAFLAGGALLMLHVTKNRPATSSPERSGSAAVEVSPK